MEDAGVLEENLDRWGNSMKFAAKSMPGPQLHWIWPAKTPTIGCTPNIHRWPPQESQQMLDRSYGFLTFFRSKPQGQTQVEICSQLMSLKSEAPRLDHRMSGLISSWIFWRYASVCRMGSIALHQQLGKSGSLGDCTGKGQAQRLAVNFQTPFFASLVLY